MNLVLFFTKGISLQIWDEIGMFDREVLLYQNLLKKGITVTFITYGSAKDLDFKDRIPGIKILCNNYNLPNHIYEIMLPWLHKYYLRNGDIYKSNQTNGADMALRAAQIWDKPLIARCGYMWSFNSSNETGEYSAKTQKILKIEKKIFNSSDRIIVTTTAMADYIVDRIPNLKNKIKVIPNYVDANKFAPSDNYQKNYDIIYVGRLSKEKNLEYIVWHSLPVFFLVWVRLKGVV